MARRCNGMGRGGLGVAQRPIPLHIGSAETGVDRRCEIAKTAMRSHRVVIVLPACQHFAGMGKRREQRLVEAFVPQPAVEALDERILLRFSGRDVAISAASSSTRASTRRRTRRWKAAIASRSHTRAEGIGGCTAACL